MIEAESGSFLTIQTLNQSQGLCQPRTLGRRTAWRTGTPRLVSVGPGDFAVRPRWSISLVPLESTHIWPMAETHTKNKCNKDWSQQPALAQADNTLATIQGSDSSSPVSAEMWHLATAPAPQRSTSNPQWRRHVDTHLQAESWCLGRSVGVSR